MPAQMPRTQNHSQARSNKARSSALVALTLAAVVLSACNITVRPPGALDDAFSDWRYDRTYDGGP